MTRERRPIRTWLALACVLPPSACVPDAGRPDHQARAFLDIVRAEDARPAGGKALATLMSGTRAGDPFLRAAAVRGLGRLERPAVVDSIAPLLHDAVPHVRAEAANALAQAVHRGDGAAALGPLLAAADVEQDAGAAAAIARSLGRLAISGPRAAEVERALVETSRGRHGNRVGDTPVLGAVLGMESWTRRNGGSAGAVLRARAVELATYGGGGDDARRIRALALTVAARLGDADRELLAGALDDPSEVVRAAGASGLARLDEASRAPSLARALADPSSRVRTEAIRILSEGPRDAGACAALGAATSDPDVRAAGMAVDALARPCPDGASTADLLERLASTLSTAPASDWHLGGHALRSLASVAPARARPLLPAALGHANPFARAWGARAAGAVGAVDLLRSLLGDQDSNVATQAALGLAAAGGENVEGDLVVLLGTTDDAQVVVSVAPLLHGPSMRVETADAALATLGRLSEPRWQTLRDPRMALLDLVEVVGDSTRLAALEPYLRDYDPAVAARAGAVMESWTGKRFLGAARGSPPLPLPTAAELRTMEHSAVVLHMARGGEIEIELLPLEATTNAFRLFELARQGRLDGLTLHRVVPNFVVQGGSPRANEYGGHGAYTRDEVGLRPQWRGTVGLSTRGRDTGDGQIYVNLVDNVRLGHDYTLMGVVVSGMDVVDTVLEGDVIERAEVRTR